MKKNFQGCPKIKGSNFKRGFQFKKKKKKDERKIFKGPQKLMVFLFKE